MSDNTDSIIIVVNTDSTQKSYDEFANDVINRKIQYDTKKDTFIKNGKELDYNEYEFFDIYISGLEFIQIEPSERFYRAIGYKKKADSIKCFMPISEFTKDEKRIKCNAGRYNPEGAAYLYMATSKGIAQQEVRATKMDAPMCRISPKRTLTLVSLYRPEAEVEGKNNFKKQIDVLSSAPVLDDDEKVKYIITQIIARYIKTEFKEKHKQSDVPHIDGIKYSSSFLDTEKGQNDYNIVLFDLDSVIFAEQLQ